MADNTDPFLVIDGNPAVNDNNTAQVITNVEYPTAYSPSVQINSILESMNVYDRNHINTQIMREKLAAKIMNAAMNADLDEPDAEVKDVNLHLLMEARSILNDLDKAAKDNVAVKLKKKDTENAEASNINMAEFLAKIKLTDIKQFDTGTVVQSADEISRSLDMLAEKDKIEILDTEMETEGMMLPEVEENLEDK
jgi:hypothetical protein